MAAEHKKHGRHRGCQVIIGAMLLARIHLRSREARRSARLDWAGWDKERDREMARLRRRGLGFIVRGVRQIANRGHDGPLLDGRKEK
jgi:hypothetical protein